MNLETDLNPNTEMAERLERGSPAPQRVEQAGMATKVPDAPVVATCCGSGEPRAARDSNLGMRIQVPSFLLKSALVSGRFNMERS